MANTPLSLTSLHIGGITIHQDENGRFSLNDLHQAAGGEKRFTPSRFARSAGFKALVDAINVENDLPPEMPVAFDDECSKIEQNPKMASGPLVISPVQTINGGTNPGVYVVRELVYAYAMWISPAFHLKVIRTFDALMMGRIQQVRDEAQHAIEVRDNQLFFKSAKWSEELMHRNEGEQLIRKIKTDPDPHMRRHHFNALASLYRRLGDEPPEFSTMEPTTPLLGNGPSREELMEKVEELERVRDVLLEALLVLHRAAEIHLINHDDLAPSDGAYKAIKLAMAHKRGAK